MASDNLELMQALGFEQFSILAHDRGARVGHRLALDHRAAVQRMMLLDIARPWQCTRRPTKPLPAPIGTGSS
jgi:pimeloyl-ACP methyl ester carboxylesterase